MANDFKDSFMYSVAFLFNYEVRISREKTQHTSSNSCNFSLDFTNLLFKIIAKFTLNDMLDFIYSAQKHKASNVTLQDAVPLRFLASYFGVEALFKEVNNFIENDLEYTNVPIYLAEAMIYDDKKILDAATLLCAQNVKKIAPEVMAALPLKCFRETLISYATSHQRQKR